MLPLTTDTPQEATAKRKYQIDNGAKVRGYALGKSQLTLDKSPKTSEKIETLQAAAKETKSQIEIAKYNCK